MALKHLLNKQDYGDDGYSDHRQLAGWSEDGDAVEVSPVLPDTSWNDLDYATELPSSDSVLATIHNIDFDSLIHPQEHVDQWATDHMRSETTSKPATPSLIGKGERICYGMIFRAKVRLRGDMAVLDTRMSGGNNCPIPGHYQMTISKRENQFVASFSDGTMFGEANAQLEQALAGIEEQQFEIELELFAPIGPIRDTISRATKEKEAIVRVNINVYGPRSTVPGVGQELSKHKIYLQKPDYIKAGFTYDNPHVLKLAEFQLPVSEQIVELQKERRSESELQKVEAFKKTISTIYSSLTRGQNLRGLEGDGRLKTQLLLHQEQALDFMTQRESGPVQEKYRLWQPSEQDGRFCYRHAITNGTTQLKHNETGGGILADEMGMVASHDWVSDKNSIVTESTYERTKRRRSGATLIVASSDLMINEWFQEMDRHFDYHVWEELNAIKYHGTNRETNLNRLCDADIVITTYHTLYSDSSREKSPLHDIEWYRLVLDEAHIIRRQSTVLYKTVADLKARSRWCLTGTPIQNRLEDIGTLFAFLRIIPFNNPSNFRKCICIPFEDGGKRRDAAIERFTQLLDSLCLRRTKDLLNLPDSHNIVHEIEFSPEERIQYEQTKKMMLRAARNQVGGLDQKSTLGLFQVQLQLRILCNHGTYQQPFSWNRRKLHLLDQREDELGREYEIMCSTCKQTMPSLGAGSMFRMFTDNCRHVLCTECIEESMPGTVDNGPVSCPLCSHLWKQPSRSLASEDEKYFRSYGKSSKMEALMRDVQTDVQRSKSIIFSCWTHTLDLIALYLQYASISFARIDGDCPTSKRERILEDFAKNPQLKVLIMTTGTGAVGLNLATANRVFIVEPQWNPSVENQATARALRIGQAQQVQVNRYVVNRTVEQDMRSLQDKKLKMAGMAWE